MEPEIAPLEGGLILIDAPVLAGFAEAGLLDDLIRRMAGRLRRTVAAGPELVELSWTRSTVPPGLQSRGDLAAIPPQMAADTPEQREEVLQQLEAAKHAWLGRSIGDDATASAASAYITAHHWRIPLITHRPEIRRLARPSGQTWRPTILGAAEVIIYCCRPGGITAVDAWDRYVAVSRTVAGETFGWTVPACQEDMQFWSDEAAASRF
jgi:hypothetical protein